MVVSASRETRRNNYVGTTTLLRKPLIVLRRAIFSPPLSSSMQWQGTCRAQPPPPTSLEVEREPSWVMWRLNNNSIALLTWIVVLNVSLRSYFARHSFPAADSVGRQSLAEKVVVRQQHERGNQIPGGRILHLLLSKANEWVNINIHDEQHYAEDRRIFHYLTDDEDDADNIHNINVTTQHRDYDRSTNYHSVRLQVSLNPLHNSSETQYFITNQTQSTTITTNMPKDDNDTILDDLTRGFTFAALFCFILFCLHKCFCYTCMRCGCCPDDERVMQARMRKLRLMKKRAYNPDTNNSPPLDTRKWAQWMRAHRGTVDTAEDCNYYYSAVVPGGGSGGDGDGGVWDANTDDGSTSWDDETGFVDFEDTGIMNDGGGLELASRSRSSQMKNAIPELEYGEGEELEDECHDSRLFDAEDGGKGVNREADRFFTRGHRGKENGGDGVICHAGEIEDTIATIGTYPTDFDRHLNSMQKQSFFDVLHSETTSVHISNPEARVAKSSSSVQIMSAVPHDLIPTVDDFSGNEDEDIDTIEMGTDINADDRGYDEETDLLGLRSDSPPPMDLEAIQKLMEDMENAKPY